MSRTEAQVVRVPETIVRAVSQLNTIGAGIECGEFSRAAIVWAFSEPKVGGRPPKNREVSDGEHRRVSFSEFSSRRIYGLTNAETVSHYWRIWQALIDEGIADPVAPGEPAHIPEVSFQTYYDATKATRPTPPPVIESEEVESEEIVSEQAEEPSVNAEGFEDDPEDADPEDVPYGAPGSGDNAVDAISVLEEIGRRVDSLPVDVADLEDFTDAIDTLIAKLQGLSHQAKFQNRRAS